MSDKKHNRHHKRTETISQQRLEEIWENTHNQNLNKKIIFENANDVELEKVDGNYLKGLVPINKRKKENIQEDNLRKMEHNVLSYLVQRAIDGHYDAEYNIPAITPGIPVYELEEMQVALAQKLRQRPELSVKRDNKNPAKLYIEWK